MGSHLYLNLIIRPLGPTLSPSLIGLQRDTT